MEDGKEQSPQEHLLSELGDVPENLDAMFKAAWIETVEQAVSFICAADARGDEVEEFLGRANGLLGEDRFRICANPVPAHPLGCLIGDPFRQESAEDPVAERVSAAERVSDVERECGTAGEAERNEGSGRDEMEGT